MFNLHLGEQGLETIKTTPLSLFHRCGECLTEGLNELCEGMISLRKQNGAVTSLTLTSALLNERTDKQVQKLLGK